MSLSAVYVLRMIGAPHIAIVFAHGAAGLIGVDKNPSTIYCDRDVRATEFPEKGPELVTVVIGHASPGAHISQIKHYRRLIPFRASCKIAI